MLGKTEGRTREVVEAEHEAAVKDEREPVEEARRLAAEGEEAAKDVDARKIRKAAQRKVELPLLVKAEVLKGAWLSLELAKADFAREEDEREAAIEEAFRLLEELRELRRPIKVQLSASRGERVNHSTPPEAHQRMQAWMLKESQRNTFEPSSKTGGIVRVEGQPVEDRGEVGVSAPM